MKLIVSTALAMCLACGTGGSLSGSISGETNTEQANGSSNTVLVEVRT